MARKIKSNRLTTGMFCSGDSFVARKQSSGRLITSKQVEVHQFYTTIKKQIITYETLTFDKKTLLLYCKFAIMNSTVGITIERNGRGLPSYARIDLSKYGERLLPFFREVGVVLEEENVISDTPNKTTKKAMIEAQQHKTVGFNSIDELLYDLKH